MAHILDSLSIGHSEHILCCYANVTPQFQIIRIGNIPNWFLERTVFPGQRLLFEALPQARLEIHTSYCASAVLADTIPCTRLRVQTGDQPATPLRRS